MICNRPSRTLLSACWRRKNPKFCDGPIGCLAMGIFCLLYLFAGICKKPQYESSSLDQRPEVANPPTQPILHVERELLDPYDRRGIHLRQPLNITLTYNCYSY
jgi:energy-converting hydrogenase Eha subunit F